MVAGQRNECLNIEVARSGKDILRIFVKRCLTKYFYTSSQLPELLPTMDNI